MHFRINHEQQSEKYSAYGRKSDGTDSILAQTEILFEKKNNLLWKYSNNYSNLDEKENINRSYSGVGVTRLGTVGPAYRMYGGFLC